MINQIKHYIFLLEIFKFKYYILYFNNIYIIKMDIEKDTWHIIDSYFKSNTEYLAKHHLDSYNDLIDTTIPKIFKQSHVINVFRSDIQDDSILYSSKIYLGGKNNDKFHISKPTIFDYKKNEMRILYPNEARLKNLLYGADIFMDIDIEYSCFDEKTNSYIYKDVPAPNSKFMENKFLTRIPIMLHSKLCSLSDLTEEMRREVGEGMYDIGGYFIIDGREKIIVSQERKAENKIFIHESNVDKITHYAEVKSTAIAEFQAARTNRVQLESEGTITFRMGQSDAFLEEVDGRDIPIFIVFRLLGIESDKKILEYICYDLDDELSEKMIEILRLSVNDRLIKEGDVYDQETATLYCENIHKKISQDRKSKHSQIKRNKVIRLSYLYNVIYENLLPHVGNDFNEKAYYLGMMVRKLLMFKMGIFEETNRDNFNNKRIDLSGGIIGSGFRNALREFIRKLRINVSAKYEFEPAEYSGRNFINIVNENNFDKIFDNQIFDMYFIKEIKKGNIAVGPRVKKTGVIRTLERLSYFDDMSHVRRIVDPADIATCATSRRRLHGTQYGCVCPVETPEGQNVGLQKALSMMSLVSFGTDSKLLITFIKKLGVLSLFEIRPRQLKSSSKIFVNGQFIGVTDTPIELVKLLVLLRRNKIEEIVDRLTSITYYTLQNEVIINTDDGRFCRPLYIIENNEYVIQPKHIEKIKNGKYKWIDLFSNKEITKKDKEFIENINFTNILDKDKYFREVCEVLDKNKGVIEYLDSDELHNVLLSSNLDLEKNKDKMVKYTHCELHFSMILGSGAFLVPFIEHNQAVRCVYATKHSKKAIGTYSTAFNNRFDTSGNILNYPDRPLVTTRMAQYIHNDEIGSGNNIIIAITCHNGYNQEDAIIGNRKSFELGLFNTSMFKMYEDFESSDPSAMIDELFYNPTNMYEEEDLNNIVTKKDYDYENLDEFGFIKEGTYLKSNDIVMGKYMKYVNDLGRVEYKDASKKVKKDNEGSLVDKVFSWKSNVSDMKVCKVRTCQVRIPDIGDKFANRCAQKGTLGMILDYEDMPFTKNGIVPDLVVNPYGYTSRMTVGGFLEMIYGKMAIDLGMFGLGSPFEPINPEEIGNILEDVCGMDRMNSTVLYDGVTGKMMNVNVYSGPAYFQRLKQQVKDKINYRTEGRRTKDKVPTPGGAYTNLDRQVVSGRAHGGGLKIGEMERDSLIAHGITSFLKESFMERGDKFIVYVNRKTKNISVVNPNKEFNQELYFDPLENGPVHFHLSDNSDENYSIKQNIIGLNTSYQYNSDFFRIEIPYSFKLLVQELRAMLIDLKLEIEGEEIDVNKILLELNNIEKAIKEPSTLSSKKSKSIKNKSQKGGIKFNLEENITEKKDELNIVDLNDKKESELNIVDLNDKKESELNFVDLNDKKESELNIVDLNDKKDELNLVDLNDKKESELNIVDLNGNNNENKTENKDALIKTIKFDEILENNNYSEIDFTSKKNNNMKGGQMELKEVNNDDSKDGFKIEELSDSKEGFKIEEFNDNEYNLEIEDQKTKNNSDINLDIQNIDKLDLEDFNLDNM